MPWPVERVVAPAAEIHALGIPDPPARLVRRCDATAPAVVLGSLQREPEDDGRFAFVRRRSGGGAVYVEPGGVLWVDVVVPAGDAVWDDDVGRAFRWLGDAWALALRQLGVASRAHHGRLVTTRWSRDVCFAGLGPGEVVLDDGRKVVGIAQRRTRAAALFQCAALLAWDPAPLVAALGLPDAAAADLTDVAAPLPVAAEALFGGFLRALPT